MLFVLASFTACGTMRTTDTRRTANEQLLLSDSIDRAVQLINFRPLAGRSVYLDETYLNGITDRPYLVSTLRQHMLGSGCRLAQSRSKADYIVEARCGAIGTNRQELLFGIPAINVPSFLPISVGVPSSIPEVPIAKSTTRTGVSKLAIFAYHRETGAPVWQSGLVIDKSTSKDSWLLGAGPFQRGTIHDGAKFAGSKITNPLVRNDETQQVHSPVSLRDEMVFESPLLPMKDQKVMQATATEEKK